MVPAPSDLRWVRPPQQARSQETLDRLLDAAEALVADKGFEDVAVAEVARRAGSSVGAFYTRFRDKEGLIHALYERFLEQGTATADAALDPARWEGATVGEVLTAVVRFLVTIHRERRGLIRAFVLRNRTHPEFQAQQERLSQHVNRRLGELLRARADEIAHPDPGRAAHFGFAMVMSTLESTVLFDELRSGPLAFSDESLATELTRAFLAYLGIPR